MYLDNEAPEMSVSVVDGTTYSKSKTATVTINDNVGLVGGTYRIKYGWGTSAIACSNLTSYSDVTVGDGAKVITIEDIPTPLQTGIGKLYVCNESTIVDKLGNSLNAGTTHSTDVYLDNEAPTISLSVPNGNTPSNIQTGQVTIADNRSGLLGGDYAIKYAWSTSVIDCADMSQSIFINAIDGASSATGNITIENKNGNGKLYICNNAVIVDKLGNELIVGQERNKNAYMLMHITCRKGGVCRGIDSYNSSTDKCVAYYYDANRCRQACGMTCVAKTGNTGDIWTCNQQYTPPSCTLGTRIRGYCYLYNQISCPSGWSEI